MTYYGPKEMAASFRTVRANTINIAKEIPADIVKTKMTTPTIISQQIVEAKPEVKLPEVKKKPSSGVDPYREPLI